MTVKEAIKIALLRAGLCVAKSKYKANANFGEKRKSPILIQDHGDSITLRDIKVREFSDK